MNTKQIMMASTLMAVVASTTACSSKTAYNTPSTGNLKTSVSTTGYGTGNMNDNYTYTNKYTTNMNNNKYATKTNMKTNGNSYTAKNGYTYNVDGTKYTNRDFYADGLIDNNTYTYNDKYNNAYRSNYDGGYAGNETMTEQIVDNVAQMGENVKESLYGTNNLKTGVYNTTKAVENNMVNGKVVNNKTPYLSYDNSKLGMNVNNAYDGYNSYDGTYGTNTGYNGMTTTYTAPNTTANKVVTNSAMR